MHIWLVSIFEQTPIDKVFSTRFISIANEALNRGHKVTFFGSTFKHNTKNQRFVQTTAVQQSDNYQLVFIKSMSYKKNISFRRLLSHYIFSKSAINEFEKYPKPDIILLAFPPISLAYELAAWAENNNIPLIIDIIDTWPDIFKHALPKSISFLAPLLFGIPQKRFISTLSKVRKLTAISNQYLEWASSYYPINLHECLYPAADFSAIRAFIDRADPLPATENKKLKIIYAGSLASSYDIHTILAAAKLLESYNDIYFYIAGAGPKGSLIKEYCRNHNNLSFLGRLTKEELMRYYASCDLGMTQHVQGATQSVTYKLFDLLSAGLPILNSLESEMREIIIENKVGLHNTPGDAHQLMSNILYFYQNDQILADFKANGLKLAKKMGDTKVIYRRFVDILEENQKGLAS